MPKEDIFFGPLPNTPGCALGWVVGRSTDENLHQKLKKLTKTAPKTSPKSWGTFRDLFLHQAQNFLKIFVSALSQQMCQL